MSMKVRNNGLSPKLGLNPKRPTAEADFWVSDIAPGETLDDVLVQVLAFAPKQLIFRIPNHDTLAPSTLFTRIYQTGVEGLEMISATAAKATVLWGQTDAAPAPSAGGQNPDGGEGSEGEGPEPDEVLGPEYKYSSQGGTRHITQSLETKSAILEDGLPAPNVNKVIGLSRDRVEGCDVISGDLSWSMTMRQCQVGWGYWRMVCALTGTINKTNFCGCLPGEILFTGATGDFKEGDGWTITWNFLERANEKKVYLGNSGAFTPKDGHDYVWYSYRDGENSGFSVQVPAAMYVERVYRYDMDAEYTIRGAEFTGKKLRDLFKV